MTSLYGSDIDLSLSVVGSTLRPLVTFGKEWSLTIGLLIVGLVNLLAIILSFIFNSSRFIVLLSISIPAFWYIFDSVLGIVFLASSGSFFASTSVSVFPLCSISIPAFLSIWSTLAYGGRGTSSSMFFASLPAPLKLIFNISRISFSILSLTLSTISLVLSAGKPNFAFNSSSILAIKGTFGDFI